MSSFTALQAFDKHFVAVGAGLVSSETSGGDQRVLCEVCDQEGERRSDVSCALSALAVTGDPTFSANCLP